MASDNALDPVDSNSRRICPSCNARMSSFTHDRHSVCVTCRGVSCTLDSHCNECSSWEDDVVTKYVKNKKSLASKLRSRSKAKKPSEVNTSSVRSRSSSEDSCATPSGSGDSVSITSLTEARVQQLISSQLNKLSDSFAASMEASFVNIQQMIDIRLASNVEDVHNRSFSTPSPVPVLLSPSQGQQDPSMPCQVAPVQGTDILGVSQRSRCWLSWLCPPSWGPCGLQVLQCHRAYLF